MAQVEREALARVVVLGDLGPVEVCGAWMESADRRCGRPAADPWLCSRHVRVARARLEKYAQKAQRDRQRAEAKRVAQVPRWRAQLVRVEKCLEQLEPRAHDDPAVVNLPLSRRLPSDSRISELARLHQQRQQLRDRLGSDCGDVP